ncbi:MAG: folate family ECF transporter S component [Lachnospiraceae bacterium]
MKKLNSRVLAFSGVLIAMSIVLARVVAIPIGNTLRLTVSSTPIYLAGLWFGPAIGGICGGVSDILGCILSGYAPNPLILVSSVLCGVLPGLFKKTLLKKVDLWRVIVVVGIHGLVGSLGFTTLGLHLYYGTPWVVLYTTRPVQTLLLTAVNSVLVYFLYKSPLTSTVTRSVGVLGNAREMTHNS